jgi:hypothetical protein
MSDAKRDVMRRANEIVNLSATDKHGALEQGRKLLRELADGERATSVVAAICVLGTVGEAWIDAHEERVKMMGLAENN